MVTCALCKRPITEGQRAVGFTHYWCEVQLTDSWRADLDKVTAQRDEALSALKAFVDYFNGDEYEPGLRPLMDSARAAIAKTEVSRRLGC